MLYTEFIYTLPIVGRQKGSKETTMNNQYS